MKTCIVIIVLSNFFIFGKSEELSCKEEVQEAVCKSGTLYKEESFQTCLESNRLWKKYKKTQVRVYSKPIF
jgi:hypothetical protein